MNVLMLAKIAVGSFGIALAAGLFAEEANRAPATVRHFRCSLQNDAFYHLVCEERQSGFELHSRDRGYVGDGDPGPGLEFIDRHDPLLVTAAATHASLSPAGSRYWRIPLYNIPFQSSDVVQLVRTVMCPRGTACEITVDTEVH
jgi:hypothetical protein